MTQPNTLIWWHFSDLHWTTQSSTERRAFLATLFKDLRERIAQFGPPDFVVFTGDITQSGHESEYSSAETHFFEPIRALIGNPGCPFFFLLGNHDMSRGIVGIINTAPIIVLRFK